MRIFGLYLWHSIMIELSWSFDCHLILYITFFSFFGHISSTSVIPNSTCTNKNTSSLVICTCKNSLSVHYHDRRICLGIRSCHNNAKAYLGHLILFWFGSHENLEASFIASASWPILFIQRLTRSSFSSPSFLAFLSAMFTWRVRAAISSWNSWREYLR